ncbi:caspase recruitment domain-containing protein 8-like, partial [Leptodactylus fuscus]|uniref:caspase recruitment domain-containing protein 8-like n=1 Tax=Leptodactylus fuscus TaxID=238119 RepID=UPI003F4ECE1F
MAHSSSQSQQEVDRTDTLIVGKYLHTGLLINHTFSPSTHSKEDIPAESVPWFDELENSLICDMEKGPVDVKNLTLVAMVVVVLTEKSSADGDDLDDVTEEEPETEDPQRRCEKMTIDGMGCRLCGQAQDSAELVSPTPMGSTYQLLLRSPGLYRCQKTGIKFQVKGPVTIEYRLDSWSDHLRDLPDNSYEVVGPLFNIQTCSVPNTVSAVYLPHYLCLKGFTEDTALVKIAHFRDGNLTLETPAQTEPFYITLQDPTFSCLGPLLLFRKKKTPIHGIVLIYFKIQCKGDPEEESKIHLYTLPYIVNAEE